MAIAPRLAAVVALGLGLVVFGGANVALAGTLTGSNYNAACGGAGGNVWTSCVRPGGGQTVIVSGTDLSDCTAIVAMGGGWTGSVPLTPNGGGTSFSFVVPNDSDFWGWAEILGCTVDSSVFFAQGSSFPRLDPDITVTGLDEALTAGETPTLDYSALNAPSPSDWGAEPICRAYLPSDLSSYVAGALSEGSYVIQCSEGVPVADADVIYVNGTITVNADSGGTGDGGGESGGGGRLTTSDGSKLAYTGVNSLSLIVAGMLGIAGIVGGSLLKTRRSTSR